MSESYFYTTKDPLSPIQGAPALTTLLYEVCKNDSVVFDNACRLVGLFVEQDRSERS